MFNRQPYNRGKFNVTLAVSGSGEGTAPITVSCPPVFANRQVSTPLSQGDMVVGSEAISTLTKFNDGTSFIQVLGTGVGTLVKFDSGVADLNVDTEAISVVAGEAVITLRNINLAPGQELIINTCDFTVTKNGQNAMETFTVDSDFFSLLQGNNEIVYSDNASARNIFLNLIWKDRWI